MSGLDTRARAKLNLSLDVLARRPDGFHDLRMVMQAAALADEVHVELREPGFFRAETNRSYIPTDERHTAVKAAKAHFEAARLDSGASLQITTRIPGGAGAGGGGGARAAGVIAGLRAQASISGAVLLPQPRGRTRASRLPRGTSSCAMRRRKPSSPGRVLPMLRRLKTMSDIKTPSITAGHRLLLLPIS